VSRSLSTITLRTLSFVPQWPIESGQEKAVLNFAGKKVCFDYLVHIFSSTLFSLGFLAGQPGNEPGAKESDH
jgi:hypothetical protein